MVEPELVCGPGIVSTKGQIRPDLAQTAEGKERLTIVRDFLVGRPTAKLLMNPHIGQVKHYIAVSYSSKTESISIEFIRANPKNKRTIGTPDSFVIDANSGLLKTPSGSFATTALDGYLHQLKESKKNCSLAR